MRRFTLAFLALLFLTSQGFAQRKPKENAQVLLGFQAAGVNVARSAQLSSALHLDWPPETYTARQAGQGTGVTYLQQDTLPIWPGLRYGFSVSAESWDYGVVNFKVPEGCTLYINGKAVSSYRTEDWHGGAGTGFVELWLLPNDGTEWLMPGYATTPGVGDLTWSLGLGRLSNGRSAGALRLRASDITDALFNPDALLYTPPTSEVRVLADTVSDHPKARRFISAPQAFILFDDNIGTDNAYLISVFQADAVPWWGSDHAWHCTQRVADPSAPLLAPFAQYKIQKTGARQLTLTRFQDGRTDTWTMTKVNDADWSLETNSFMQRVVLTSASSGDMRVETVLVQDPSTGAVATKTLRSYQRFAWGQEELVSEVADPDGVALSSVYTYGSNPGAGGYGKLRSVASSNGSWTRYDYYDDPARWGQLAAVYRPWQDGPGSAEDAHTGNAHVTLYDYTGRYGGDSAPVKESCSLVEERALGATVNRTTMSPSWSSYAGQPMRTDSSTVSAAGVAAPLTSTTSSYDPTADLDYSGKLILKVNPDGTQVARNYVRGNLFSYVRLPGWRSTYFQPDTVGAFWCETELKGAQTQVAGSEAVATANGQPIPTTYLIPDRSIMRQMLRSLDGGEMWEFSYVYTGGGAFQILGWKQNSFGAGLPIGEHDSMGAFTSRSYIAGHVNYETAADGTKVQYFFDDLLRVTRAEKKGIAAAGSFPAQPNIETTYTYDAAGHVLTSRTQADNGGPALTTSSTYNLAGLLTNSTGASGLTTFYSYTQGGRTVTTTLPGTATQTTDMYLDGTSKSVTGSAVVGAYQTMTVNGDGSITTQVFVGSNGSPRWTKTTTDGLGRTVQVESPSFGGGTVVSQSFYSSSGQLARTTQTGLAETLYVYDGLGQLVQTGLHVDGSGGLAPASNDRISEMHTKLVSQDGAWWSQTLHYTYHQAGNATPLLSSETLTRLDAPYDAGAYNGKIYAETRSYDVFRNLSVSTTVIDAQSHVSTTTTVVPTSSVRAVSVAYNGLAQSQQTAEGLVFSYHYDGLGRLIETINPRTGSSTQGYFDENTGPGSRHQLAWTKDTAQNQTSYSYYSDTGRTYAVTDPRGKAAYTSYNSRGQVEHAWGPATYPVEYSFDSWGALATMKTFRDPSVDWSGGAWPGNAGTGDQTTWNRDPATGLLLTKVDAQNHTVTYSYTARGQLQTRTWARGVGTTYGYDGNTGEETSVSYSDGTPTLSYSFDRRGLMGSVNDFTGTRNVSHSDDGKVAAEYLADFYQNRELHSTLDTTPGTRGRIAAMSVGSGGNPANEYAINYGYDGEGRLNAVAGFTYHFVPDSNLIANVVEGASGTTQYRTYESNRDLRASVDTIFGGTSVARFAYGHDELGRRISNTQSGAVFSSYQGQGLQTSWGYNDRSEVVNSQTTFLGTGAAVGGRSYQYAYDNIGNRTSSQVDGATTSYTANELNQYTQRAVPGQVLATGFAPESATVTDNGQPTNRQGEYYYLMRAFDNGGASWQTDNLVSSLGGSVTLSSFLPANPESYTYDADGNLLTDGRWQYTWDAENRLTSMETSGAAFGVGVPSQRLEFQYDYLGRRVLKRTLSWSNLVSERRFLYDGWNLLEEFDTTSGFSLVAQHVWGIDLGGGLQDAGGVGGLLLTTTVDGGSRVNLIPAFDGNGNVHAMIDAASGSLRAKFEYNAFGETLRASGDLASKVPFRFSTKYTDQETQFLYYGFRYYNPNLGRFLGRDPMEEAGGLHLYGFCGNNGVNRWDVLGMDPVTEFSGLADPSWTPIGTNLNMWVAPDHKVYHWIDPDLALLDFNDPYWDAHANDSHSNNYEEYAASLNAQQDKMSAQNEAFFEDFDRRALQDPAPGPVAKTAVSPPSVVAPNSWPLTVDAPKYPTSYNVNNQGTLTIDYSSSTSSKPVDGAPNGVTSASLTMTFVPEGSRSPTNYSWTQVITNDPYNDQKSPYFWANGSPVPYVDDAKNTGSFEGNFPSGYKNGTLPIYNGGALNFYDRPQNPVGYPVGFSTTLNDKTTKLPIIIINWQLPSKG